MHTYKAPKISSTKPKTHINISTERIFKLSCNESDTEAIFSAQEIEKVRNSNALIYENTNSEFFTFSDIQIELLK